jgi:hypothetical protein
VDRVFEQESGGLPVAAAQQVRGRRKSRPHNEIAVLPVLLLAGLLGDRIPEGGKLGVGRLPHRLAGLCRDRRRDPGMHPVSHRHRPVPRTDLVFSSYLIPGSGRIRRTSLTRISGTGLILRIRQLIGARGSDPLRLDERRGGQVVKQWPGRGRITGTVQPSPQIRPVGFNHIRHPVAVLHAGDELRHQPRFR